MTQGIKTHDCDWGYPTRLSWAENKKVHVGCLGVGKEMGVF